MKKWLLSATLISCMSFSITPAWASDGLWRHHHKTQMHAALQPVSADVQASESEQSMHRWDVKSSVQISSDALREAYLASRDAYTKKLQKYAKCSEKDAQKAVTSEHPGMRIQEMQLRNIRRSLVYMAIVEDDQDKFLVVVDAGNGKILLDKPMPTHHERVFAGH